MKIKYICPVCGTGVEVNDGRMSLDALHDYTRRELLDELQARTAEEMDEVPE